MFEELKRKLSIGFYDKEAIKFLIGGVTREWFRALSREILNPNYALFKNTANSATFQPSL